MRARALALALGFLLDCLWGDPEGPLHPVAAMGRLIACLERALRRLFPRTPRGERRAGAVLWLTTAAVSFAVPWAVLRLCAAASPWLRLGAESVLCWLLLAPRCLRDEAMRVYGAVEAGDLSAARAAVARIVGRDVERLELAGVTRAAVETVAENASDGVIAPMLYFVLGGAPLGFLYKAVNTMDSMLGYVEEPYRELGLVPARMDDLFNLIPARLSALLMLAAGGCLGLDVRNGWNVFRRDRYKHASPNSAQTESACAGLLGVRLAGDAWYHGALHRKPYIGDPRREIVPGDIPAACRLMYAAAVLALALCIPLLMVL